MPTYVYKFIETGETIEVQQAFTDDALTEAVHPVDGTVRPVKKVFTPIGVTFKGGGKFDLDDFKAQLSQMKKMGGLSGLMDKLPAQFQQAASGANVDQAERQVRRMEGIINSMTAQERAKPELIKASRKRRIAAGAGVQVQEVNRMLSQFEQMQSMMKKLKGGGMMKMMRSMKA